MARRCSFSRFPIIKRRLPMKLLNSLAMGAAVAALMLASSANAAFAARAYIGTYTPDPADPHANAAGHGEGIYLVDVDPATGAPSNPRVVAKTVSPSWIVLSADRKFLYAVKEINTFGPSKSGSVTAFAVDQASGALKQLNVLDSGGSIPCFISIDPSGKYLLVADYTGGAYEVIRLKADGSLDQATDVVKPTGPMSTYTAADKPVA